MGTSTSSFGPGPGVSLDPPWLSELEGDGSGSTPAGGDGAQATPPQNPNEVAPPRRFAPARRELGNFIRGGGTDSLKRSIGHYSRTGMGGARRAAARMRVSTSAAANLFSFLNAARDGTDQRINQWVQELLTSNPSVDVIADAIVKEMAPAGGSVDEESLRDSMALAISDLIALNPNIELLQLSDNDSWELLQLFLSHEVCNRLQFDIGQFFESARLDPSLGVQREMEMRDFVRNELGVQLSALRQANANPTTPQLNTLIQDAVRLTFEVYEGVL